MSGVLYGIVIVGYFGLGLYQLGAVIDGLEYWLGIPWIIALVVAFFVTWIPLIGTVDGVLGAHFAWGWSWLSAIGLFAGPLLLMAVLSIIYMVIGAMSRNKPSSLEVSLPQNATSETEDISTGRTEA